ncbi:hypothetical protein NL676_029397 [Syzygium grande]|nr:hypothetical protein NL676_029397 [Syzygium grande]
MEAQTLPPPSGMDTTLFQAASSPQMYVDELPQIPNLFDYTMVDSMPKPTNLTISTYKITRVRLSLLRKYFLLQLHHILVMRK